jgi:tetratricopeptide (TPR) repeat protein
MQRILASIKASLPAVVLIAFLPLAALAQDNGPVIDDEALSEALPQSKSERLDSYFADLRHISDPVAAKRIADRIWAEWNDSGSATANQLMEWTNEAMRDKRYFTALDLLDQVTVLLPDYAEGWNRRATLHYILKNYEKSMADISRVLELEPRHFGALMGMGSILMAADHKEAALQAYVKVLEVYPAMREAQEKVGELSDELTGEET